MMLGSVDPVSTSGINSVTTSSTTSDTTSSTTSGTSSSSQSFASVLGSTTNSQTSEAEAQAKIFTNQLAEQQAYLASNSSGGLSSGSANNTLLTNLDYQAALAMMQHNLVGLTESESLINQQMTNMGMTTSTTGTTGTV